MTRWSHIPFLSFPMSSCSDGKSICWLCQSQGTFFECVTSALIAIDVWNSSPFLAAPLLDSSLPSGNDTKCTPVFLSAWLLCECILNRFWQGDLCYRLWWSLPSLLRQERHFGSKQSGKKRSLYALSDLVELGIFKGNWKMNSFLGDITKVKKSFQS